MAAINALQIFEDVVEVVTDVEVDSAELEAGGSVQIPIEPQVGTVGGKPVYLISSLSTVKTANGHETPLTAGGASELIPAATEAVAPNAEPTATKASIE